MTDEQIIDSLLRREGAAVTDDADDRGGLSKFGITSTSWRAYVAKTPNDMTLPGNIVSITEAHARDFYRREHVALFAWINDLALRALVIDSSVNHGRSRVVRWLQDAAGAAADGLVGHETRAYVNDFPTTPTYANLLRTRINFYVELALRDPTQQKFLRGWINRALEFVR